LRPTVTRFPSVIREGEITSVQLPTKLAHYRSEIIVKPIGQDMKLEDLNAFIAPSLLDIGFCLFIMTMLLSMREAASRIDVAVDSLEELSVNEPPITYAVIVRCSR
jgi:hypothetical protein